MTASIQDQERAIRAPLAVARSVRLISAVTPSNAEAELVRLETAFARGEPCLPRWRYAPRDVTAQAALVRELSGAGKRSHEPLQSIYRDRLDELALEVEMVGAVGTEAFGALAAERYARSPSAAADALAARWVTESFVDEEERIASDAPPRSLLSRVRALLGAHRAPFGVEVVRGLSAASATGERTVYIAAGRALSPRAAERIAVHEVLGHVLPRVRAPAMHPLFMLGTARGTDDQEGLALVYEERNGLLDPARRVDLARRHIAAKAMRGGADFVEVVRHLGRAAYISPPAAVHVASRVFRGSTGAFPGLGREGVYIPSFLDVSACLREKPTFELTLASGQVAVRCASVMAAYTATTKRQSFSTHTMF